MNKLPSKKDILDWILDNPTLTAKRDIAKAFGIKGPDRIELKKILRELEADGHLSKRKNSFRDPNQLPPVSIVEVMAPTSDGDLFARPLEWDGDDVEPIILLMTRKSDPALGRGDRILAKLTKVSDEQYQYEGRLIRKIGISPTLSSVCLGKRLKVVASFQLIKRARNGQFPNRGGAARKMESWF